MTAYYNDNEPSVVAWLRCLIDAKLIPAGDVDDRPIQEVQGSDLDGYTQCHFFAGIGGWAEALQLARWSGPVWTGSCPCQPYSNAGKGKGDKDPRNLWPEFRRLIEECCPPIVFGEQTASEAGRGWLDRVRTDLEALGYAVGAADLCAASVGSPQPRQRIFWLGDTDSGRRTTWQQTPEGTRQGGSAFADGHPGWDNYDLTRCADGKTRRIEPGTFPLAHGVQGRVAQLRGLGNAIVPQVAAEFIGAFLDTQK